MNYACLKNLALALTFLCIISPLTLAASEQGTRGNKTEERGGSQALMPRGDSSARSATTSAGEQAAANSMTVRTGIGVGMELSAPIEVSCERMSALEKVGQGKPAEVASETREQRESGGTASSGTTTDQADSSKGAQIAIPSHGRMLALTVAAGKVTISCDAMNSHGEIQHPQQSGARPSSRTQ